MPITDLTASRGGTLFECQSDQYARTILGDEGGAAFNPVVRAAVWGEEASFAVRLPDSAMARGIRPTYDRQAESVTWLDSVNNIGLTGYALDAHERGGFEFEIILLAVPLAATMDLPFVSSGLELLWQPPLTPENDPRGSIVRPDNVVNSIAAYHATRGIIHREPGAAAKYKTGKAFHLYRLEAIDAIGRRHWVDWTMDLGNSKFIISFDAWFLTATYPVRIDPTIGYSTHGASEDVTENFILVTQQTAPESGDANPGTATIYGKTSTGTVSVYLAAYEQTGGTPWDETELAESSAITLTTTLAEQTAAMTWTGIAASTVYWIALWSNDSTTRFYFDAGGATGNYRRSTAANPTDPFPASTAVPGDQGTFNNRPSGWLDYAASGGGSFLPRRRDLGSLLSM